MLPYSCNIGEDEHHHGNHGNHGNSPHSSHCCCCNRQSFTNQSFVSYLTQVSHQFIFKDVIVCQQEVKLVLREMRLITKKMKDKDDDEVVISDWKFAAMVIDRFCLIGLTMYTIATTVIMFVSAPHLIVP